MYNGKRRTRRFRNGHVPDQVFGRYMSQTVGYDQATLTRSRWFQVVASAAAEMFPEFFERSPFEDPDYFAWPYEHVTIDFLCYVYQIENRFELLDYAEKRHMSYHDFKNWVNNYVLSYNDDKGEEMYAIALSRDFMPYIKRTGWDYSKHADNLEQLLHKNDEGKKEAKTNSDDNGRPSP